jgi:hypothetical protein
VVAAPAGAAGDARRRAELIPLTVLPFAAGLFALLLALAGLLRKKPSTSAWCFFAGMTALGIDSLLTGLAFRGPRP